MRLCFVVSSVVLAACGFRIPGTARDAPVADDAVTDGTGDAPIDAPPDAPPIDARVCPPAPGGCTAFLCAGSASCYFVCNEKVSWTTARGRCTAAGGCLATINSLDENTCFAAMTQPAFPNLVWFGFRQTGANEPAGGWDWQCPPSTFVAPNWGAFEPNDENDDEDCGALITGAAWIDGDCDHEGRYVCEL